jgi:hypothetical protein
MSFFTSAWVAAIRARAQNSHLAEACHALDIQVAAYRTSLPALPEQQAGYYHDFFCPAHGVQLTFDPHSPHHHACPVDHAIFSGEPFDSAWLWSVNDALSEAAFKFAFRAFLHAGQNDSNNDGTRAREILIGYAARYRTLPRTSGNLPKYPGHALWSSLDESVWIIRLVWVYAFLVDTLSATEHRQIREGLMQPAADHIRQARRTDIHNITNWNNAALATLAIALSDEALFLEALDGPAGLHAQLTQGVRADGLWWEGSLSYHYYTLAALIWTLRVLRASGRPVEDEGTIHKMFAAPLALAFPDLSLPAMNDCWYRIGLTAEVGHGIPDAAGLYEVGYGWYGDPEFAWILRENYARRPRTAIEALLDGADDIPSVPEPSFVSQHLSESGIAVLRTRESREQQTCLILKASPRGSSHDHPDQLGIQLFSHGVCLSPDLGTPGYGIGLTDAWYRQTISHNTVLLDGCSQPLGPAQITQFRIDDHAAFVQANITWNEGAYAGVRMHRMTLWREHYFIDVFLVSCREPHQIDWVYHSMGELFESPISPTMARDSKNQLGYAHIVNTTQIHWMETVRLSWRTNKARLALLFTPFPSEEVFTGCAPSNPASEGLSVVVRRQTSSSANFLSVFCLSSAKEEPVVRRMSWTHADHSSQEIVVETTNGSDKWTFPSVILPQE